jgi:hypothetical protein
MTKTLTALIAAATLATATSAVPTTADARCVSCAVGAGERPADAPPGYVYYPAYGEPLPGPNCNWFRMPVYDAYGNMVGWRGRPVAFCSWLAAIVRGHCLDCASVAQMSLRDLGPSASPLQGNMRAVPSIYPFGPMAHSCNAINDAYATGLIRQRTTALLGAQTVWARQQHARDRG